MIDMNVVLFSSAIVVLKQKDNPDLRWLLVKNDESSDWGLPKAMARKGESSVRAGIRMMSESAGLNVKVSEEVGRAGGATKLNGEAVSQRTLYYLMSTKNEGENLSFFEMQWFDYGKAVRKLDSKQEQQMLKSARDIFKKTLKYKSRRKSTN